MIKICLVCKKEFKTSHKKTIYCSKKCYLIERIKKHLIPKSAFKKGFHPLTEWKKGCPPFKTSFKKGQKSWNKGKKLPQFSGKNHPRWKGGKYIDKTGKEYIFIPYHPFCDKRGYMYKSRFIMEKYLGRYLKSSEVVHHINKNPSDNRIKNLILFKNQSEHMKFHHQNS